MSVELPLRVVVTILECCVTFSGVKLSIRSFVLFMSEEQEKSSSVQLLLFIWARKEQKKLLTYQPLKVLSMQSIHLHYRSRYINHLWNLCEHQIHYGGIG